MGRRRSNRARINRRTKRRTKRKVSVKKSRPNYSLKKYRKKTRKKKLYGGMYDPESFFGVTEGNLATARDYILSSRSESLSREEQTKRDEAMARAIAHRDGTSGKGTSNWAGAEPEPEPEPEPEKVTEAERSEMLRERERQKALAEASMVRDLQEYPLNPFGSTVTPLQGVPVVFSVYSHIDGNGEDVYKAYSPIDNYRIYKAIIKNPDVGEVQVTEPRTSKGLNVDGHPHIRKLYFGEKASTQYLEWVQHLTEFQILEQLYTEQHREGREMYNQLIQSSISGDPDMAFVRIAKNRAEPSPTTDTKKISCLKEKPTLGTWPERRMQIKNQSLRFYNMGDTTLRGSSITDLTGAIITPENVNWPLQGEKLIITIKPNLILNPPEQPKPRPFKVEANHSTATYPGQTKTVALDAAGETKIALPPLLLGTVILDQLETAAGADITYSEPEPVAEAKPLSEKQRAIAEAMAHFAKVRLGEQFGIGNAELGDVVWAEGAATPVQRGWTADDKSIPSEECE